MADSSMLVPSPGVLSSLLTYIRSVVSKVTSPTRSLETAPTSAKRQPSPSADPDSKRACLSHDNNALSPVPIVENLTPASTGILVTTKQNEAARTSSIIEDKKRGQRLFGSFLSVLNQNTPSRQQKRRLEIEKRQLERAKVQKVEDEVKKAATLEKLKAVRINEQFKFDEESMHIRHANMLAMANFLCTKTEPKLEECIKSQISAASAVIEREVSGLNKRHDRGPEDEERKISNQMVGEPRKEAPSATIDVHDTANPTFPQILDKEIDKKEDDAKVNDGEKNAKVEAEGEKDTKAKEREREREEHNGEVMVENEEDTVIY